MSLPGTKVPPSSAEKDGVLTAMDQTNGSKRIDQDVIRFDRGVADIGVAPTSRAFTLDYTKVGRAKEDVDLVTAALGNPFQI
jgi:hypothetical protein